MIQLDTHVVTRIYSRRLGKLSATARRLFEQGPCSISPVVIFELEMLFELGRVPDRAARVVGDLGNRFGLAISQAPFADVVEAACTFAWTRDPFDRLIVANAMADGVRLLSADETILRNYTDAVW